VVGRLGVPLTPSEQPLAMPTFTVETPTERRTGRP
jgi:hypothetical protein